MSYSISQQRGKDVYNLKRFTIDEVADMSKLPTSCAPGSTAFVVATSQTFMLNNKYQWVEIISSGSGGMGNVIWDGGDPQGNDGCCGNCGTDSNDNTDGT